jgi:hypothetical protein
MKFTNNLLAKAFPSVDSRNRQIQKQAITLAALALVVVTIVVTGIFYGFMDNGLGYIRVVVTDDGKEIYARNLPIDADISPIVDNDLLTINYRANSSTNAAGLLITGNVSHVSVGTEIHIDPIPNIDGEISSARVSVTHSTLDGMKRIEHSAQAGDYYESPIINSVTSTQLVMLTPEREAYMGMSAPGDDSGKFKIALSLLN